MCGPPARPRRISAPTGGFVCSGSDVSPCKAPSETTLVWRLRALEHAVVSLDCAHAVPHPHGGTGGEGATRHMLQHARLPGPRRRLIAPGTPGEDLALDIDA